MRQRSMIRRGRSVRRLSNEPAPELDLVGMKEIAKRMRVGSGLLRFWFRTGAFPQPDYRFTHKDAWLWGTVEAWLEKRRLESADPRFPPLPAVVEDSGVLAGDEPSDEELLARFDDLVQQLAELEAELTAPPDAVDADHSEKTG